MERNALPGWWGLWRRPHWGTHRTPHQEHIPDSKCATCNMPREASNGSAPALPVLAATCHTCTRDHGCCPSLCVPSCATPSQEGSSLLELWTITLARRCPLLLITSTATTTAPHCNHHNYLQAPGPVVRRRGRGAALHAAPRLPRRHAAAGAAGRGVRRAKVGQCAAACSGVQHLMRGCLAQLRLACAKLCRANRYAHAPPAALPLAGRLARQGIRRPS